MEKAKDLCEETGEEEKVIQILVSLSRMYVKTQKYEDALTCNKSLITYQIDSSILADVFQVMGQIYTELSKFDQSMEYLNKSLSIHKALRDPNQKCIAYILLDLAKVNELCNNTEAASENLIEVSECLLLTQFY